MKRSLLSLLTIGLILSSCSNNSEQTDPVLEHEHVEQEKPENEETVNLSEEIPEIVPPDGYTVLADSAGDLTKDGRSERILVYNTNRISDFGTEREIIIYQLENNEWAILDQSSTALMQSEEGGMMGDPFDGIEIKNGVLIVRHWGGSAWKWSTIDKYRYQNDQFELIGFGGSYGMPCEYWDDIDFNLSTGRAIFSKDYEDCEDGREIPKNLKEENTFKGIHRTLKDRQRGGLPMQSAKHQIEFYL